MNTKAEQFATFVGVKELTNFDKVCTESIMCYGFPKAWYSKRPQDQVAKLALAEVDLNCLREFYQPKLDEVKRMNEKELKRQ